MERQMIDKNQTQRLSRIDVVLILCGIIAPVIWFLAILIAGSLRPEYSHVSQAISELGARDTSFNKFYNYAGVMPAGILTFSFSLAMFRNIKKALVFYISSSFVAIVGITRFLAGIFLCDPGCFPIISIAGRIHALSGFTAMFAGSIAPLVMAIGLRHRNFKTLFYLSIVFGLACLVLFTLFFSQLFSPFFGAIQRLILILTYSWIIAVAVNLKRFANSLQILNN